MSNPSYKFITASQKTRAAKTDRAFWKVWVKCTESEETEKFFFKLLMEGVGIPADEEFLISVEGRRKSGVSNLESRMLVLKKITKMKLDDCSKGGTTWRIKR